MLRLAVPFALAAAALVAACNGNAVGVGACKSIETARCQQLPSCPGLSQQPPVSTNGSGVDECIRYYEVACLHGLAVGDPGTTAVNACVSAIERGGCDVVAVPESDPGCAWLVPPAPPDAGEDDAGAESD